MLADRGMVLDSANPDLDLMRAIVGVADQIPELRIVVDHLPSAKVPTEAPARDEYWYLLRHLAQNRNVFVKLSEVIAGRIEQGGGSSFAKDTLDGLWDVFGEDHVLYASDWPNSDHHATYLETISVVRDYVGAKSRSPGEILLEEFGGRLPLAKAPGGPTGAGYGETIGSIRADGYLES